MINQLKLVCNHIVGILGEYAFCHHGREGGSKSLLVTDSHSHTAIDALGDMFSMHVQGHALACGRARSPQRNNRRFSIQSHLSPHLSVEFAGFRHLSLHLPCLTAPLSH